jgi:pimeloyl-ACP methyl ester carboxylesterase
MKLALKIVGGLIVGLLVLIVGTYLALRRPDISFETLEAKYGNSASHYLDLPDGLRVHYRDQGNRNGPALVLVHGFSASLHTWEPWVQRLGDQYRIITLDLPGHGLTRAPATYVSSMDKQVSVVAQTTERLGVTSFVLGGNSMGGGVAWTFATLHPERLKGLVLINSVGLPREQNNAKSPLAFKLLRYPLARALGQQLDTSVLVAGGLKAAFYDNDMVDQTMIDRHVALGRAEGHRAIILNHQAGRKMRPEAQVRGLLGALKMPVLVMHGQEDVIIPVEVGQVLAASIPGSTLILYPKVGHIPMEEVADRSAVDLAAWLKEMGIGAPARPI